MGTSQSGPGPKGDSPLIPPWADDQPGQPVPQPEPRRFASFRQSMGKFATSQNRSDLKHGLKQYATKSTGGGGIASRRLGSVSRAGGGLFGVITGTDAVSVPGEGTLRLADLAGRSSDSVISIISNALTSDDGDADKIRTAMNYALIEALDGVEVFDPDAITDDVIVGTMINYLSESIFLQIVMDAGKAWNKAETAEQAQRAENDLREFVNVIVDKYMEPRMKNDIQGLSTNDMIEIERQVIREVWSEWETYQ